MDAWRFFDDPRLLHAAAVHFPVALGVLGVPLALVAAMTKMRFGLRQTVLAVYLILALAAFGATTTGAAIQLKAVPPGAAEPLEVHSAVAGYVWIGAMVTAVLFLLTAVKSEWFRAMFTVLGVLGAVATAALIVITAVRGQALVYEHGIGPKPVAMAAAGGTPAPQLAPAGGAPAPQLAPAGGAPAPQLAPRKKGETAGKGPESLPELEAIEPAPPQPAASSQPQTAEEALAAWRNRLKNAPSGRGAAGRPQPTQYERVRKWFRKYMWPF